MTLICFSHPRTGYVYELNSDLLHLLIIQMMLTVTAQQYGGTVKLGKSD